MSDQNSMPTTQRAYTLRLRGFPGDNAAWREALWATHEAVNKGAKVFGDWLLTLRGGLDHKLADEPVKGKDHKPRSPNDAERRDRRILLALSWFSVEDGRGAPSNEGMIVATGADSPDRRARKLCEALATILKARGANETEIGDAQANAQDQSETWLGDCMASLSAAIRDDAVWVNRSAAFDLARETVGETLTREECWDLLGHFFTSKEAYFASLMSDDDEDEGAVQEKSKDLVQKAGKWLSSRFGTGQGANFERMANVYHGIATWADETKLSEHDTGPKALTSLALSLGATFSVPSKDADGILSLISGPGYKSATRNIVSEWSTHDGCLSSDDLENLNRSAAQDCDKSRTKIGAKGQRLWANALLADVEAACGLTYLQTDGPALHTEFSVMLDHAARRVSIVHSWIKRAEQRRRQFETDAQKLTALRQRAEQGAAWLDQCCEKRSLNLGAGVGGYRIRKRAIEGWDEVVRAWSRAGCENELARIAAARELQANPEIDKFGDIQLFEALAIDQAKCVWQGSQGQPDSSLLKDYVAGKTAEYDRRRFKVPAYRHPDPLRHPVFCDFGNSRWDIRFAVHDRARTVRGGGRRAQDASWINNRFALQMGLWNGESVDDLGLRWSCKRLSADLALDQVSPEGIEVTRADRLGRAASDAPGPVSILNVFDEDRWNGRLQAPRSQLDRIAGLLDKGKSRQAETLRQRIRWLISFSPRLEPGGPFIQYVAKFPENATAKPYVSRKGDLAVKHSGNESRSGHAKLLLSRLPGLRILSVDLGHRFAAACAVWEALSREDFDAEIAGAKITRGGSGEEHLFLHAEKSSPDGKRRTVICRRIAADMLADGMPHPAPWARLDRQFLIKLQGEEIPARKAAPGEIALVRRWEEFLGRQRDNTNPLPFRVDALMSEAVTTLSRGLRRHADSARIAFNLTAKEKLLPGGGRRLLDRAGRVALITQTFALWHGLFSGSRWKDPWAQSEWKRRGLPEIAMSPEGGESSAVSRRVQREKLEAELAPHSEKLVDIDLTEWSAAWKERWQRDDANWSGKNGFLRSMRAWVAPRGLRQLSTDSQATVTEKKQRRDAARQVGGLSVGRINTISELYQLLKAFWMRPEPDDLRKNVPQKNEDELTNFNRRLLDMRDRLRDQRVKQLASRIVEAALGVGRIAVPGKGKQPRRPRRRVDIPCEAVVIESLTYYRPDDLRTRRENRMLMQWSSSKVHKFLKENCQLHGILLREVPANYTSRQDSRTGMPGIRCDDVTVQEFLTAPWWNKIINSAKKKRNENRTLDGNSADVDFFLELREMCERIPEGLRARRTVRVPRQGGDLLVGVAPELHSDNYSSGRAVQADLNAAANIGLRALMDPDFPGKWWYVPCGEADAVPVADKVKGSMCFATNEATPLVTLGDREERRRPRRRRHGTEIANYWSDPSALPLLGGAIDRWRPTQRYWVYVRDRVIELLRVHNRLSAPDNQIDTPW